MFDRPAIIQAEIHARLPDRFRRSDRCEWGDINNGGRITPCFLEAPAFDRDGNLYLADIPYGRIFRVDGTGAFDLVAEYDGEPNGLAFHRDGRLFIADYKNGILMLEPGASAPRRILGRRHTETFKGVNDLVFASNGDLYFTDQGQTGMQDPSGRVYRLTAQGHLQCLISGIPSPNGIALNAAETLLFVAVTRGNCVWRAPIMPDGQLSKVGLFIQMSGGVGPDGMALDTNDGLAVAHPGLGGAWLFDRRGLPTHFVAMPDGDFPTNVAFGDAGFRSLFVVESSTGCIMRAPAPRRGHTPYSHQ